ncbi:GNAT family N-acetyltransferase [Actinoplanes sp. CA-030573]|uniref:GNAT family N-acetyltransferase n=1 Tax=Actinoplanes sp. CA-030573 TaxID=3239898 RepID=UPI003D8BC690
MPSTYPPLNLRVRTPRLTLAAATDELLERLAPVVRAGVVAEGEVPFDDPISLYEDSPVREWRWMQAVWRGRARVDASFWRLYFVVCDDGEPVGMQDLIGRDFAALGTVTTFSWLAPAARGRGLGREARAAILHLAFEGFGAREATTDAFADNHASNRVSELVGYTPNGTAWATRRGEPAELRCWRMTRERWAERRRDDIELSGVEECKPVLLSFR